MDQKEIRLLRNIFLVFFGLVTVIGCTACSVQWAIKNKHTDCGFTNDRFMPNGQKDPTIFYGTPKSGK